MCEMQKGSTLTELQISTLLEVSRAMQIKLLPGAAYDFYVSSFNYFRIFLETNLNKFNILARVTIPIREYHKSVLIHERSSPSTRSQRVF